jgi:transposase
VEHLAIDLGGKKSQVCVRDAAGQILEEVSWPTRELRRYLSRRPVPSRVTMETCAEAFGIADIAKELGHEVRVVPSVLVRGLGVGARGIKTDVRDARALSEASCMMPSLHAVHIPSKSSRERKSLCGMRDALVSARTQLVNTVRGWLRADATQMATGESHTFPSRVRKHYREKKATTLPGFVERQLEGIESLSEKIKAADQELLQLVEKDAVCVRLMTMPGVGPVVAARFAAALDDASRFGNAHRVESYLGLTPGEQSSSDRQRRTGITKAGPPQVRAMLTQAAWSLRRSRPNDPMVLWALEVEQRRGKRVAIIALARKMAGVLYALWRDSSTYDPAHRKSTQMP